MQYLMCQHKSARWKSCQLSPVTSFIKTFDQQSSIHGRAIHANLFIDMLEKWMKLPALSSLHRNDEFAELNIKGIFFKAQITLFITYLLNIIL